MSDDAEKMRAMWEIRTAVYTLLNDVLTRVIQSDDGTALRDAVEIGGALMSAVVLTSHYDPVAPLVDRLVERVRDGRLLESGYVEPALEVLDGLAPLRRRLHRVVANEDRTVFGPVRAIDILEQLLDGRKSVAEVQALYPELPPGAVERVIEWAMSELTASRPAAKD